MVKLLCCISNDDSKLLVYEYSNNHSLDQWLHRKIKASTTSKHAHTIRVNEKIDIYSFGVILLELTTGQEANDGDEHTSLAQWAWRHIQKGNPIVDALDEEVKEPCYLDEMSYVFNLGIICTDTQPSKRPSMKDVVKILLKCNQGLVYGEENATSLCNASPLLKNSKSSSVSENDDYILRSIV
ncbi:receptor-like protein kinase 5 [Fagus crenata]